VTTLIGLINIQYSVQRNKLTYLLTAVCIAD